MLVVLLHFGFMLMFVSCGGVLRDLLHTVGDMVFEVCCI